MNVAGHGFYPPNQATYLKRPHGYARYLTSDPWNIVFLERRGADAWIARLVRVRATLDDINGRGEVGRMAGAKDAYGPHRIDRYITCLDLAGPGSKGFAPFTFYLPIIHQQTAEPNRLVPDWRISCGNA